MYDIGIPNAKGGNEMRNLWEALVNLLNQYGQYGAGMASVRGSFEAPVPKALQK